MSLFDELKQRKVFKVGGAYLVVAWLAIQAASIAFPTFDAPPWALRVFILIVLLGFPLALVLAWVFDVTPEGVKKSASHVGNKRIYAVASALVALALLWYYVGAPAFRAGDVDAHAIAVLPFENMSGEKDNEYFSDGISEEILNTLAQTPGLKVAARTSSFSFKGKSMDVPAIAHALKVRMVLEGSVRKQGDRVRITAQLIDASNGFHVWSQTYDRQLKDVFAIQDEIAHAITHARKRTCALPKRISARRSRAIPNSPRHGPVSR
jgi:TolB-like protein